MAKILVDVEKLQAIKGYVHGLLDFIDVDDFEDPENKRFVVDGYDDFVGPINELINEAWVATQEREKANSTDELELCFGNKTMNDHLHSLFVLAAGILDMSGDIGEYTDEELKILSSLVDIVDTYKHELFPRVDGYNDFIGTVTGLADEAQNAGTVLTEDVEAFKDNLEDLYDVDVSQYSDEEIAEMHDEVLGALANDDQYNEIYNDCVWAVVREHEKAHSIVGPTGEVVEIGHRTEKGIREYLGVEEYYDDTEMARQVDGYVESAKAVEKKYAGDTSIGYGLTCDFNNAPFVLEDENEVSMEKLEEVGGITVYRKHEKELLVDSVEGVITGASQACAEMNVVDVSNKVNNEREME